jgi:hypothetical protein
MALFIENAKPYEFTRNRNSDVRSKFDQATKHKDGYNPNAANDGVASLDSRQHFALFRLKLILSQNTGVSQFTKFSQKFDRVLLNIRIL